MQNSDSGITPPLTNVYTNKTVGGRRQKPKPANPKKKKKLPAKDKEEIVVVRKEPSPRRAIGLSKQSYDKHKIMVDYMRACTNPNIRGMLAHATANPLPTNNALAFYAESLIRITVATNNTLIVNFPLGQSEDYENANGSSMDGQSFHQCLIGYGAVPDTNIVATGVLSTTLSTNQTKVPVSSMYALSNGLETMPASFATALYGITTWDTTTNTVFPIAADVRPGTRKHLRQALISASIEFLNETPIGTRGGSFYTWEPMDSHLPIATTATSLDGSYVRELPTFRMWPSNEEIHKWVLVGNKKVRSYCHDDAPPTEAPTTSNLALTTNNKGMPLNLMFVNSTGSSQGITIRVKSNWSVGGDGMLQLGRPVAQLGEAMPHAVNALSAANATGSLSGVVKSAISSIADAGARFALSTDVAALGSKLASGALSAVLGN